MNTRYRNLVLFALVSVFFGGSFVAIELGIAVVPPVLYAALRFDIGAVLLLAYAFVRVDEWRPQTRGDWGAILASGLLVVAINNSLLFMGQQYTTSALASVMYSFAPVLAPVLAVMILGEDRLSRAGIVGVAAGFLGIAIVVQPDPGALLQSNAFGIGMILIAAVCVALGGVLTRRADQSMSSIASTAWAMLLGAVLIHSLSLALGETPVGIDWSATVVLSLVYMGVLATAVAYACYFELLDQVGVLTVNLTAYVVPIFASVFSWLLLGQSITPTTLIGFVFIVGGFVLIKRRLLVGELRRLPVPLPRPVLELANGTRSDARTQTSSRSGSPSQGEHYSGTSVQSHDRSSCDD